MHGIETDKPIESSGNQASHCYRRGCPARPSCLGRWMPRTTFMQWQEMPRTTFMQGHTVSRTVIMRGGWGMLCTTFMHGQGNAPKSLHARVGACPARNLHAWAGGCPAQPSCKFRGMPRTTCMQGQGECPIQPSFKGRGSLTQLLSPTMLRPCMYVPQ